MSGLDIQDLSRRYGDVAALERVSLSVPDGALACLLGPSGSGKTTLLRIIAGLEEADEGAITLDGVDITALPAHERDFGIIFPSLALFPHLNVGENIAYPLRLRRLDKATRRERVAALLALVRLAGFNEQPVSSLGPKDRLRVAIARALALSPRLLLLDDPFASLDVTMREEMRTELRQLQQRLGITTLLSTQDAHEAMAYADLVVLMSEGQVLQAASPLQIYRKPANPFVANFMGATNLLPLRGDGELLGRRFLSLGMSVGRNGGYLSIRPEDVRLVAQDQGTLAGTVIAVRDLGERVETHVDVQGTTVMAISTPRERFAYAVGEPVGVHLSLENCTVIKG